MKTKQLLLSTALGLVVMSSSTAFADTSADNTLTRVAQSGVKWLNENALTKMHDWSVIASFAATNKFQVTTWSTDEIANLKTTSDYARFVLALLAAGYDPHQYQGKDYVQTLASTQMKDGVNRGKFADNLDGTGTDLINVQAWTIIALEDAGQAAYNRAAARDWLTLHQNKDGGFGYSKTYRDSDPDDTASAILALSLLGVHKDQPVMLKALGYLHSTQGTDGGFGSGGASNSDSTGVVIDALTAIGERPSTWTKGQATPESALLGFQDKASGGFNYDTSGGSYSGVNAYSTRDGLVGTGALITERSVYQRLHWQRLDNLNAYWRQALLAGGVLLHHVWQDWGSVRALATAGSYEASLNPYWQSVMKAHGMYVSGAWTPWNEDLAKKALIGSFGLNNFNLNQLGS